MVGLYLTVLAEHKGVLDNVLKLPDVAGIVMRGENIGGFPAETIDHPALAPIHLVDKTVDQQGNVFTALSQRREGEGYDIDSIIKIPAELLPVRHLLEIFVGGGYYPG